MIDIATPMNSMNDENGTPGGENGSKIAADKPAPSANGTMMLAAEIATVIDTVLRRSDEIELEADEKHVEDHAELRDDAEDRRRVRREQPRLQTGSKVAEQRRAEQDAADDLANDRRLVEFREQPARQARRDDDHGQRQQHAQQHFVPLL